MSYKTVKLGDICDLANGYAFKSEEYVENSGTLNCRMSNIRPGGQFDIDYNPKFLPDNFADKYKQFLLKDGDLVIAMTDLASSPKILGVPTIVKTKGRNILLNQRVGKLVIRDKEKVHFPYLKLVLNYPKTRAIYKKFAGGGLQINLGKADLLSVTIPLPSLPEQKRIAEVLDKADALREKRRLALQKLDTLLQSVFLEMFGDPVKNPKGWDVSNLGGICKRVTDGTHQPPKFTEKGIPFLFVSNIRQGIMSFTTNKFISEETYSELTRRCPIEIDDILYTIVGSYGNAAVVKTTEKFAFQRHIAHIKPNSEIINSEFLLWMLLSEGVRRQVDKKVRGIAQQTLNLSEIKTLQIFCPPKVLQEKFALISKEINKLKINAIKSEVFSENLFKSLQQRAFKGELFNNEFPPIEPQEEKVWQQTSLF